MPGQEGRYLFLKELGALHGRPEHLIRLISDSVILVLDRKSDLGRLVLERF